MKKTACHQIMAALSGCIDVSQDLAIDLCRVMEGKKVNKNEEVLRVGDVWGQVSFICSGGFRLFYLTEGGKMFNKGFFFENQFMFPIASFARSTPSRFSVSAMCPSVIVTSRLDRFQEILGTHGVWERFICHHAEWLAEQKVRREAEFLLDDAATRYQTFVTTHHDHIHLIPDYHIASFLGITPVALSRIRAKRSLRLKGHPSAKKNNDPLGILG